MRQCCRQLRKIKLHITVALRSQIIHYTDNWAVGRLHCAVYRQVQMAWIPTGCFADEVAARGQSIDRKIHI
jgi:hypothetical protein